MILSCFRSSKADEGALPYFQFGTQYEGTCLAFLTWAVGGKDTGFSQKKRCTRRHESVSVPIHFAQK